MLTWINLTNFAVAVSGLTIALLGFIFSLSIRYIDKRNKRFFVVLFTLINVYITFDLLTQIQFVFTHNGLWRLSKILLFCESLFSSLMMPLLTKYILRSIGEECRKSPAFYIVLGLWVAYFALLVITQFTDVIYYVTADNVYHRGALYPALLVPPALLMLMNIIILIRRRAKLTRRSFTTIFINLIIPLLCMIVQMLSFGLLIIVIGTSISALFMFVFILIEQMEHYIAQNEQIARQKVSISVLRMRPHFIYNTLTSIYYLCKQDPDKAQQITMDFTSYLRKNFTAIAKEGDIPFREELEHTRAYLAVEKARFEDKLYVEFDTPHISFRLPPLTLQPIVENAVKHGLDPELDPLYITVISRRKEDGSEITVKNTGVSYDGAEDKPQLALDNIRERLETVCGGSLKIVPQKSGGTAVTIFIPYKKRMPQE